MTTRKTVRFGAKKVSDARQDDPSCPPDVRAGGMGTCGCGGVLEAHGPMMRCTTCSRSHLGAGLRERPAWDVAAWKSRAVDAAMGGEG